MIRSHACALGLTVSLVAARPVEAALTPEQARSLPAPASQAVSFSRDIRPILATSCTQCHGRGKRSGGFSLETRDLLLEGGRSGPAVVVGRSAESHLVELVSGVDPDNVMPEKGSRLTATQIGLLRAWIDQGLPWDAGATFARPEPQNLRPRQPQLPPAKRGVNHPIDRLLQRYFEQHEVKPGRLVDDRAFARRVYFDVSGLPPAPDELAAFLRDSRSDKRRRLVERLLDDDLRYAEHWLTFWNDALRNDYRGTGYIDDGRKQISAWLFSALNRNLPYDQFVAQLVNPQPGSEGFAKGIVWRGVVNASQTPEMQAAQNISQVFMGVNLKCASCHDSFVNDWKLADAYGLASLYAEAPIEMFRCDKPTGATASMKFLYPELGAIDPQLDPPARLRRLAEIMTSRENGRLPRTIINRLWARFMGRGLVEPVDEMDNPAWCPDLLDWLAEDLVAHGYDLKISVERILTSRAYQLTSVNLPERPENFVFRGPSVRRLSAEQFRDALSAVTGIWQDRPAGDFDLSVLVGVPVNTELPARWIWATPGAAQGAPAGTVQLRKSVHFPAVPARARAIVAADDRFTLLINGTKVASGDDVRKPVAVDLRPHLRAGENVLVATVVNEAAEGKPTPAGFAFYARATFPSSSRPDKLEAGSEIEFGSDGTWTSATNVVEGGDQPGAGGGDWAHAADLGPLALAPWGLGGKFVQVFHADRLDARTRAAMANADPLTTALGRPNREQVVTSRATAATTLQALELTNGETLAGVLRDGSRRLAEAASPSARATVETIYARALSRAPTADERRLAETLVGQPVRVEGVEDLLWAMAMLPEFQLLY